MPEVLARRLRRVGAASSSDVLGRCFARSHMFPLLLISVVIVPVLLGMRLAARRDLARGLGLLVGFLLAYDVLYLLMLYYLRVRWVGWS